MKAVTSSEHQGLCNLAEDQGHKELVFTPREWSQLKELVDILEPFLDATDLTQGQKVVTISAVVPCILSLNHHLHSMHVQVRYLSGLVKVLEESLKKRFKGVFVNVQMEECSDDVDGLPFGDFVYIVAALLDPAFCLLWLEHDALTPDDIKVEVKKRVKGFAIVTTFNALPFIKIKPLKVFKLSGVLETKIDEM